MSELACVAGLRRTIDGHPGRHCRQRRQQSDGVIPGPGISKVICVFGRALATVIALPQRTGARSFVFHLVGWRGNRYQIPRCVGCRKPPAVPVSVYKPAVLTLRFVNARNPRRACHGGSAGVEAPPCKGVRLICHVNPATAAPVLLTALTETGGNIRSVGAYRSAVCTKSNVPAHCSRGYPVKMRLVVCCGESESWTFA